MTSVMEISPIQLRKKAFPIGRPTVGTRQGQRGGPAKAVPQPRAPLADFERRRLREKVAEVTCSVPWSDHVTAMAEQQGVNPNIEQIVRQLAERGIYPPRPDPGPAQRPRRCAVRMRRCDVCGRIVPPNNLASNRLVRICDDCRAQPDADPDLVVEKHHGARAPGAQFGVLVEGSINDEDEANRRTARRQLLNLGLTDAEVLALSFTHAGYSTRGVAELGRWGQTYVRKLIQSARRKIQRSGLLPPKSPILGTTVRPAAVDPLKLDLMPSRSCR